MWVGPYQVATSAPSEALIQTMLVCSTVLACVCAVVIGAVIISSLRK